MTAGVVEQLRAGLEQLVRLTPGLELREREQTLELIVVGGHGIAMRAEEDAIAVEFGGWVESIPLDAGDEEDEAPALALDFAAAAVFGELRVTLVERSGEVMQRRLDVRVDQRWRMSERRGRLGLMGLLGRASTRVLENRIARPASLREQGPTGQPHALWAGAGPLGWVPPNAEAKPMPIDGELDLHDFPSREVAPLVREYIEECRARGIRDLRIVHGKGIGALRRTVHALLAEHPDVESWRLGGHGEGSWGATIVRLRA